MLKTIKKLLSVTLLFTMLGVLPAQAQTMFPPADGIDYGSVQERVQINPYLFMSSYTYNTSNFSLGVYLDSGNAFQVDHRNEPYFMATHSKVTNNDPNLYRVTYQAIYDSSGAVRQGIPFLGPIDNIKVQFSIGETNKFKFYIAGDGTNAYKANGKLYYGGI